MSEQQLWNQVKKTLQKNTPGKLLHSILNTVTLESSVSNGQKHLTLKVPSSFHQNILRNHLSQIQTEIKTQGYKTINIKQTVPNPPLLIKKSPPPKKEYPTNKTKSAFFSKWTFSSFIQGPGNCFAFSLAKSIVKQPTKNRSNPLFIYGPSGLGKTHLLHAIGSALEKEKPYLNVRYLPAERFFNDCINHIRKNEMPLFRQKYRKNIQVLLLDDIQILGKGESTQEEFFHTFENLRQEGCQIVLVSDQKPGNIKGLKERIKTRFEGGVVTNIEVPDKDTKIAIIRNKIQKNQMLSEEIISYIAGISTRSIREIEGLLNKLKMFCELQNKIATLELVQQLFSKDFLPPDPNIPYQNSPAFLSQNTSKILQKLQKEVCSRFQIKPSQLKSSSRSQHLVQARNTAMYIARTELKLSLKEIGSFFGNRNHSTVLNSLKKTQNQQQENKDFAKNIQELKYFIHKER